ncbi:hypothetical protein ACSBR2_001376 [Camellia fascicularis]
MKGSKLFVLVILSATFQYCSSDAITTTTSTPPLHKKEKKTQAISPNPFGSSTLFPVKGSIHEGYYYTNLRIGKSHKSYSVDIDTGSQLTWVICDAYPPPTLKSQKGQSHHDPYKLSRVVISCDDPLCNYVKHPRDDPCRLLSNDNPCPYQIEYGDGSSSTGTLVRDYFHTRFTNGSILRSSLIFGCGTYHPPESDPNKELFGDGVLGLANGKLSIVWQLREKGLMLNKIGHCFNSKKGQQGYLFFGDYLDPSSSSSIEWTPMVTLSKDNNHYSPGSADLLFDNKPTSVKNLDIVFDSGATYVVLTSQAYQAALEIVQRNLDGTPLVLVVDAFLEKCWGWGERIKSINEVKKYFKSMALNFTNARNFVQFQLPPQSYLIISPSGNVCFGISYDSESAGQNIIADIAFQDKLVVYDNERKLIGWTSSKCIYPPRVEVDHDQESKGLSSLEDA